MSSYKKFLPYLLLINLLFVSNESRASDDIPEDDTTVKTPVVVTDKTAFDDPNAKVGDNLLWDLLLDEEVQEDLTTARDGNCAEDEKDESGAITIIDQKNEVNPSEIQLPALEELNDMDDKIKGLRNDIEKLIVFANHQLHDLDPVTSGYFIKIQKLRKSPEAYQRALRELEDLKQLPKNSSEAADIRKYLDWLVRLPWNQSDNVNVDIVKAKQILDRDHSGLDKIKERIIEELAVRKRVPNGNPPILCFVGPPGVGKTTLGKAIADATGRKFVRIPLGGIRDEAKIRGFLRTYIGAKPGQIIKTLADIDTNNPVMLLDEIDKMGTESHQGDPAAALLEVLDRAQNSNFIDHFIDVPFDLSNILFIATANSYNIPGPLLDRLELIDLSSYTQKEKLNIAKSNLVPKVLRENGLSGDEVLFSDNGLKFLISSYTAEAGVRSLERCLGKLCRKTVAKISSGELTNVAFDEENVRAFLGRPKIKPTAAFTQHKVGATQGLAWTSVGGTLLPIEAKIVPGSGQIVTTGNLGDVMKESATAAKVVMKWLMKEYNIADDALKDKDIHVHAPEAATPKDGPSAGVTITTCLISAITGIPVSKNVAMTGEINLNGEVMAIGGLKEKLIAAHSAGITRVLIPKDNEADLEDVPAEVKQSMEIIPVAHIREVLKNALVN